MRLSTTTHNNQYKHLFDSLMKTSHITDKENIAIVFYSNPALTRHKKINFLPRKHF
jgi:hypothetical protein